ncbi:type II secretion system minor pseudopilin GspH [Pseudomonas citrulli]|uniref:Type II secretion system protein H n=1 Tax=Pseudomonas citrulli TaxID=3064347 RepID=A0ABT9C2V5_9PSED|nr:type II secretion system minor pseudopilin GspH [Pseudomonas sp. K18]MDO7897883.1 type II secretion system minor pseudopilin GspH [Pseudomonas sp. K18]
MNRGARCRGFTLLELMVVIVLMGIAAGMVSLAVGPNPAREARQQAGQFIRMVQQLRERAVLENEEYGLRIRVHGYQALRLDAQGWTPVATLQRLPDTLTLGLEQDGHAVALDDAPGAPQLLMLSSDEISPFRLFVQAAGQRLSQVSSDGLAEPTTDE